MDMIGKTVEFDGKQWKVISKIDTSRHDSRYQKRIADLNGLFVCSDEFGNTTALYGTDIGYVP
ncbi:hypothetical protein SEA_GIBBLES_85 [Gordonia phage Gibbles]|uniref:Uncharacterized protein n=3 Tax=Gordonia phage Orchid TaxID=1838075 RepID=A0A160DHG1_9CAUD|nr:hypothetical protein BH761_gp088 [Gordonia phage Orchid]ANA87323.1 hypothetical protein PBI_PATRICKSTAR_89 [Gordonia phage PatrickStar]ANA87549.1 hypothetical protein PBI_KAMPE_89 [Gordonia phage Kampe]AXH46537.1 hypothetical protein SEA_ROBINSPARKLES_90 [Gordonia phage RobinSparkles]QDK02044.1 hypothetical protein SEA_GIBBLES_85 [Gordonia phage Gibbles]ANA87434.1 hypothetical protein PBI_ORCHID_88 [Gordonia phage Orchid]